MISGNMLLNLNTLFKFFEHMQTYDYMQNGKKLYAKMAKMAVTQHRQIYHD